MIEQLWQDTSKYCATRAVYYNTYDLIALLIFLGLIFTFLVIIKIRIEKKYGGE